MGSFTEKGKALARWLGNGLRQGLRAARRRRKAVALGGGVFFLLIAVALFWPLDQTHYLASEPSCVLLDRAGRPLHVYLNSKRQWCRETELDEVSPFLIQAVVAAEDQRFWSHPGVDPLASLRAGWQFIRDGRVRSGASTLTMQLAKLAGNPSRSLLGKLRQNFLAVRLDVHAPKRDILRAYLNRASYGAILIGCEAASRYYFGKASRELSLSEAALIAALPNAPLRLNPLRRPEQVLRRRNYVLGRMFAEGAITAVDRERASAAPLGVVIHALPNHAAHLAGYLAPIARGRVQLVTTLDQSVQSLAEDLVERQRQALAPAAQGGGMVVLDAAGAEVLAWVGELNDAPDGLVGDCAVTLEPRLPALTLERFVNSLKAPGLAALAAAPSGARPSGAEGALNGNVEARPDELAAAYCMLANHGQWRPLAVLPGSNTAPRQVLSSEMAERLVVELGRPLPGELAGLALQGAKPGSRVCWKTGFSHGGHGAWAFVFNERYVVGAWIMSVDNAAARRHDAESLPLSRAVRMLGQLGARRGDAGPGRADLKVAVCAESGLPRTTCCPHFRQVGIAWGGELNRVCGGHWPGQASAAPTELPGTAVPPQSVESWFGRNFSQGSPGGKLVALSFDDGPSPQWTPQIVKILKDESVSASFFMIGERVRKSPDVVRLVAAGGFEIGCHSLSHVNLAPLGAQAVRREVLDSAKVIRQVTGQTPFLFRPPGGQGSLTVSQVCAAGRMVIVNWSVDPRDWAADSTAETVYTRTVQSMSGGAIVLLHDIHPQTVRALPRMIRRLKALGYEFTTVSRLIAQEDAYRRSPPVAAVAVLGGAALQGQTPHG